jgi:hypothetical protein
MIALPGIVLAIVGGVWWFNVHRFVQSAERAEGTVIELVESSGNKGGRIYSPVVEYTDSLGQQHKYRSNTSSNPSPYSVGDKVPILYDRDRPDSANIDHWLYLYLFPLVCFGFAAADILFVMFLFVIAMLISRWSENRKNNAAQ